ncbi:MAG: hypothetical protein ABIL09_14805 [Gemmatimonadota bacterium]
MRIYRHLPDGSRYHYYVEHGDTVVLWYPEMTWQSKAVPQPEGSLLAEGTVAQVLFHVRDVLPPDLLKQIWASVEGAKPAGTSPRAAAPL